MSSIFETAEAVNYSREGTKRDGYQCLHFNGKEVCKKGQFCQWPEGAKHIVFALKWPKEEKIGQTFNLSLYPLKSCTDGPAASLVEFAWGRREEKQVRGWEYVGYKKGTERTNTSLDLPRSTLTTRFSSGVSALESKLSLRNMRIWQGGIIRSWKLSSYNSNHEEKRKLAIRLRQNRHTPVEFRETSEAWHLPYLFTNAGAALAQPNQNSGPSYYDSDQKSNID